MISTACHLALLLLLPPLLPGVINKVKAAFAGRVGPPLLQGYFDLAKLFRKGLVLSQTTTWVFAAGPVVTLAATLLAGLLVPLGSAAPVLSFAGDPILFAYLFGLARFFTTSAALDTGSAFEGMGAAREATFACLAEPVVFFSFVTLARLSGSLSLAGLFGPSLAPSWSASGASLVLTASAVFVVLLAENCRVPFDDPNTHLELTMIHEVMVLDHSGPLLGLVLYGASVKLFVLGALLARLVAPVATGSPWVDLTAFVAVLLALTCLVGVVESGMARLRLRHVPNLLVAACVLSAFGLLLVVR